MDRTDSLMGRFSNLILGATGNLGPELSVRLEDNSLGISRSSGSELFESQLLHCDITSSDLPVRLEEFDTVYHLATLNNGEAPREEWPEVEGTENLLEEARKIDSSPRIVYVSSGSAAQVNPDQDKDWLSYPGANAVGESIIQGYENHSIVRLGNVYGSGSGVIDSFTERSKEGERLEVYGDGNQLRPFIHIEDAISAITEVGNGSRLEAYESHRSIGSIAERISDLSGVEVSYDNSKSSVSRKMSGEWEAYRPDEFLDSYLERSIFED
ncbi:MAG: NAD-dependent epimerase/dehydratase [Nanohaloarchaea archaeon]|nr:NAD-dependent epimerase/dehydratase [Candidatus Nanohaloarchaea archaeon]